MLSGAALWRLTSLRSVTNSQDHESMGARPAGWGLDPGVGVAAAGALLAHAVASWGPWWGSRLQFRPLQRSVTLSERKPRLAALRSRGCHGHLGKRRQSLGRPTQRARLSLRPLCSLTRLLV
eukprot:Amastigsp_a680264_12.p2 type:complete len:122 gc:universal Amastigsp_a680264_12:284-649(+)